MEGDGKAEYMFYINLRGENTEVLSEALYSSVATGSLVTVSFGQWQYEKTSYISRAVRNVQA